MNIKFTSLLLGLNVILYGAFFYFTHYKKPIEENKLSYHYGVSIPSEDIEKLELIIPSSKETITIVRDKKQWRLVTPIAWPANIFSVQKIIAQLQYLKPEVSFPVEEIKRAGQTIEDYGLETPSFFISVYGENKKETFRVGQPTALGNRLYVMGPDEKNILVVNANLLDGLEVNLDRLKDNKIFTLTDFDVRALELQTFVPNTLKVRLIKNEQKWAFETPIQVEANVSLVEQAIRELISMLPEKFVLGGDETALGLTQPKMRFTFESNLKRETLIIGNEVREEGSKELMYHAKLEGSSTLFTVSAKPFLALRNAQDALRDKQIMHFYPEFVTDLLISQSEKTLHLHKLEDQTWQILTREEQGSLQSLPAQKDILHDLIEALEGLEAVAFVSDAPTNQDLEKFGLSDPQRIIEIRANQEYKFIIGNLDSSTGYLYAKLDRSPYVYHIQPDILSSVPVSKLFYEERLLNAIPDQGKIASIKMTDLESNELILEEYFKDENWEDSLKNEYSEEKKQALLTMLKGLKTFTVKEYLEHPFTEENIQIDDSTKFPWSIKLEAQIALPGGEEDKEERLEYYFTKRLGGTMQIGGFSNKNRTFTLKEEWIKNLFSLTTDNG